MGWSVTAGHPAQYRESTTMSDDEVVSLATEVLTRAMQHEVLSVCVNPGHTHITSPCDDDCADHIHSCSKGCGEWPCHPVRLADTVAKYLGELQLIQIAYQQTMSGLNLAAVNLEEALDKEKNNG
ncbi:hypothetical protein PBI_CASEY_47 [Microbacterium phage Casey]|uniref:Uncharacterized protein n=1 Tax=Microbacterium phage Casey TaxID=2099442 RepID=A0A2P1CKG8_9CAUD|nr:hypothetical protein PBI_CASEY_47 [Microbacterium phage Casey]